jgi:hypothetical protein
MRVSCERCEPSGDVKTTGAFDVVTLVLLRPLGYTHALRRKPITAAQAESETPKAAESAHTVWTITN